MNSPLRLSRRLLCVSVHLSRCNARTFKSVLPLCNLNQNLNDTNGPISTLNDSELAHFRSLSSKWWSGYECRPLRTLNALRVPFISDAFQSTLSPTDTNKGNVKLSLNGVTLLDIGSGGGLLSEPLARLGANVTGIEPVEESVKAASVHAMATFRANPDSAPKYKACTIEELSADPANLGKFDGVIASEVVEHVENIDHFLKCALDCLRPGGLFFLDTINQTPLSYLTVICAAEDIFGIVPKGTHEYDKFVPPKVISLLLNDYNCDVVKMHGQLFNPLTFQWSWTQNQWVTYALMAVKRA